MTIELLAFSSSANGLSTSGLLASADGCTLTFHRPPAADGSGGVNCSIGASQWVTDADHVQPQPVSLRRRSLTITF